MSRQSEIPRAQIPAPVRTAQMMIEVSLKPVLSLWPRSFFNVMAFSEKRKAPAGECRGLLRKLGDYAALRVGWCEAQDL